MKNKKYFFHIISHTHWDREWYLPFETFRVELVELIDDIIEKIKKNKNLIFHLDGYTLLLEDYFEIKPQNKSIIEKLIKNGNLITGPWYCMADEFLTSGEATIRNLLYGTRYAKSLGGCSKVGYLLDQFGHIAQMPQILKGFEIDTAIFARGIQDGTAEHNWEALNGDSVLGVQLTHWYNNAQYLPEDKNEFDNKIQNIAKKQLKTLKSSHLILMNGCDHLFSQPDISKALNNKYKNVFINQSNIDTALNQIYREVDLKKLPKRIGELRDDTDMFILASTLSSRAYLKLQNYKLQNQLEKILEPLASILTISKHQNYPFDILKYCWKTLLKNHAHDSICGCSVDEVHSEMESRFTKVEQTLNQAKNNLISPLQCNKNNYLTVVNTSQHTHSYPFEAEIKIPLGPISKDPGEFPKQTNKQINSLELISHDNKKVDFIVLNSSTIDEMALSRYDIPLLQKVQRFQVLINYKIPGFSSHSLLIKESKTRKEGKKIKFSSSTSFENNFYKFNLNKNGTFNLYLKNKKHWFKNQLFFSLEDDAGDTYRFVQDKNSKSRFFNIKSTDLSSFRELKNKSIKKISWSISIKEENHLRTIFLLSSKNFPGANITTEITCYKNHEKIDFDTTIDNKNINKRLRIHFPTKLKNKSILCDTQFGVINRKRPSGFKNYATVQPLHNFLIHKNKDLNFLFFGGGISEYEIFEDGHGFSITLVRSIDKLSVVPSHSYIQTPEAQCQRKINFNFSILASGQDLPPEKPYFELSQKHNLQSFETAKEFSFTNLIKIQDPIQLSSFKRSEDKNNMLILRLYNPTNKAIKNINISLNFPVKKLYKLNLNEKSIYGIKIKKTSSSTEAQELNINPFSIITIGIQI